MTEYGTMVTRSHPDPKYHTRMPMESRAAQFAPFAALIGYEEAVEEAHRLTDHRPELSEEEKETLDRSLQKVLDDLEKMSRLSGLFRTVLRKVAVLQQQRKDPTFGHVPQTSCYGRR